MGVVGALLNDVVLWLHGLFGWRYGFPAWSVAARSGFALGFVPAAGALLISLIRRFTGNRFGPGQIAVFLLIGAVCAGALPWFIFTLVVGGSSPQVSRVLFGGAANMVQFGLYVVLLGLVPVLGWLAVVLQARGAFRRGPRWPRMLVWVPFTLAALGTMPLNAELAAAMWVGFLPASLLGVLLGRIMPPPSWSVIGRSKEKPEQPPAAPPSARREEPVRLADTPGPMPFPVARDLPPTRVAAIPAAPVPAALPAPSTPANGSRFNRIRKLGQGGFGEVWLAVDTQLWHTMAGALADAHGKGVLHRDVKPSNVVLDPEGTAHLIDFGIARRQGDSTLTQSGMMLGTPDYLPPEVAKGGAATPASDTWELAATVSFALTGRPPRGERETHIAALMAGANGEPCTELPQRSVHRTLLSAALAPVPARRPDLAVVQREVGGWLTGVGLTERGPVARTVVARPEPPGGRR